MPGMICSVATCKSNSFKAKSTGVKISFHKFPDDPVVRKQWIKKCMRKDKFSTVHTRICSLHFNQEDYEDALQAKLLNYTPRKLKKDAIPSINLWPTTAAGKSASVGTSRRERRAAAKERREIVTELLSKSRDLDDSSHDSVPISAESLPVETGKDRKEVPVPPLTSSRTDSYTVLSQKYLVVLQEKKELERKLAENENHFVTLHSRNEALHSQINGYERSFNSKVQRLLGDFLTPNQLDIVMKKKKRARWTSDEMSKAFTLRYLGKRAYIYVREQLHYPLPGLLSLQRWAANLDMRSGILVDVLKIMEIYGQENDTLKRITILSYGEVKVSHVSEYDHKEDEIVGPHNYMQVIMARGVVGNWKQPVYVAFDRKMTKSLLDEVTTHLHAIKYNVVGCVSDCGEGNIDLWKELNVTTDQSFFLHPITGEKIFCFADAPHLLKLIRNWFLDTGFTLEDGTGIQAGPVKALIQNTNTELSSELNSSHVTCIGAQRENVSLAAQLLSLTTSKALKRYSPGGDAKSANDVAEFIELVDGWFSIMKQAYGPSLHVQNNVLNNMSQTFKNMRCQGKNDLQNFQKGVLISIKSMQDLFSATKEKYGIDYILTDRFNQDCLKNLFSQMRTRGELHDHPSPLNALYRLRMIVLGKNPEIVQKGTNVGIEDNQEYVLSTAFKKANLQQLTITEPPLTESIVEDDMASSLDMTEMSKQEGLEYKTTNTTQFKKRKAEPAERSKSSKKMHKIVS